MQKLDTPGAISAADISSAPSGDGAIFYSYQMKSPAGPPIQAVRRWQNGTSAPVPLPRTVTGRGQLSVDGGALWLTAWDEAANPKVAWRFAIPGYVAPAVPTAPGGVVAEPAAELPNGGQPYADNVRALGSNDLTIAHSWADYLRLGLFAARLNKLVAALAQLQRQARNAGWLE